MNPNEAGAYASIAADSTHNEGEKLLAELKITEKYRVAVSAFFVAGKKDWNRLKITKLKHHKNHGWSADGQVVLNNFDGQNLQELLEIITSLNLDDAKKLRVDLQNISLANFERLMTSDKGDELIKQLSKSPLLEKDIHAIASKRKALSVFGNMLEEDSTEPEWQLFFEKNTWIFGYGLSYIFSNKVGKKLETTTTGAAFDSHGKKADGLLRTRAEISQYVLVEIKRASTDLLKQSKYRSGVWVVSDELSAAVAQIQKTTFEFSSNRFKDELRDQSGNFTSDIVYSIEPRSYVIVGNQSKIADNSDKITCFELFRKHTNRPEIITFDELYERAKYILEQLDSSI